MTEGEPQSENRDYKEKLRDAQALFVLDCDIQKKGSGDFERWTSTSYTKKDAHGFLAGGHARVIAAAEIGKEFPDLKLVTTSYYKPEDPIHAEIYKKELERLGVPESQIEMEVKSRSTLAELVEMVKMAKTNGWNKVGVLTSDYHLERVQEMYNHLDTLAEKLNLNDEAFKEAWTFFKQNNALEVELLSAEEILPLRDPRYSKIIEAVRETDVYKQRVQAEKRGVQQIKDGTYGNK
jgi:hypothetical protein